MSSSVPTGSDIGGFRVLDFLGAGASGAVYLAEDVMLERRVALKVLGPEFARDERFRERFLRESRLVASLEHPNIVPIYAAGEADGALFIAMRFVEGGDLRRLLERVARLAPERAVAIVSQVAAALDAAHAKGLAHRDVKPGNILLAPIGGAELAYLADFGLAKHASTAMSLTGERAFVGTVDYIAPEQVEGRPVDGRADVYSLGCVLFECLAGTPPFERENELAVIHAHLSVPPPRASERRPELPEQLDEVIAGALVKRPEGRYPTAGEFAAAARAAVAGLEPGLPPAVRSTEPTVRTFLFADIRGYTRFTQLRGDEAAGQLATAFAGLVDQVVPEYRGMLQELRGDEALAVFDSARAALRCAVALQRRFAQEGFELGVGMGLDVGEAVPVPGGFRGGALNRASRLCAVAGPGEVLASEGVLHLAGAVDGVRYGERRLERLKGLDRPVPAIEVVPEERAERAALGRWLRRSWRRFGAWPRLRLALVGLLPLLALASVLTLALTGRDGPGAVQPGVALLDAKSGDVVAEIPLKEARDAIFADGSFWLLNLEPLSFVQLDANTRKVVKQIASPLPNVGYFAVDRDDLWVTDYGGPTLVRIDIGLGREVNRFRLSDDPRDTSPTAGVVVGAGSVWVTRPDAGEVLRLNPRTGAIEHRFTGRWASYSIAFSDGDVWITSFRGLERIDAATNTIVATAQVPQPIVFVAAGGGFAWTANESSGTVYKVDRTGRVVASYETGEGARSVSFSEGTLWVANQDVGTITAIDASTGEQRSYEMGHVVDVVAAGAGLASVGISEARTFEAAISALGGQVGRLLIPGYELENADPALAVGPVAFHIEYATCAKLLNYGDAAGAAGRRLRPEIAAALPQLSADRRTYTFTIRQGYRFSPPSGKPVTADTLRYSIERALSPRLGKDAPGISYLGDVAGARAFNEGKASRVSGLRAADNRLSITLAAPSPDFLHRLALPFFCPVPTDTPAVANLGEVAPPSAGPYYMTDHLNGEYIVLKQNPNYTGPRRRALEAIALREGVDPAQAVGRVEEGTWDYAAYSDPLLGPGSQIAREHAGGGGDSTRYYATPLPHLGYIAFNAGRPVFADRRERQAAAFALSRRAIADVWYQVPTDQYLPPPFEGFLSRGFYRLDADLGRARPLARHGRRSAVMGVPAGCNQCRQSFEAVKGALAPIGIDVEIKEVEDIGFAVRKNETDVDLWDSGTTLDYADSMSFLTTMLGGDVPRSWLPPSVRDEPATSLAGAQRQGAASERAARLARVDVPVAAVGYPVLGEFFSPRLGCRVFPPFGYGVDLAVLCAQGR
jgi:ABC-type oligopeptide transport system substrate-binding subunit/class 3 adenylate cyclase/tRNA A-37 threonylcarbamoyl transferase component Bud32/outer membrane protein assembly factor BamB